MTPIEIINCLNLEILSKNYGIRYRGKNVCIYIFNQQKAIAIIHTVLF